MLQIFLAEITFTFSRLLGPMYLDVFTHQFLLVARTSDLSKPLSVLPMSPRSGHM
jgi:hypothetical protein